MKKKVLIIIVSILIVVLVVFAFINIGRIVRPDTNYVATIYHSEMMGIDAGTEYTYYIYPDENDTYLYVKSKADITMVGADEIKDISSGKINSVSDFEKIKEDIEKDKIEGAHQLVTYSYLNNDKQEEFTTIEELANKLFYGLGTKEDNSLSIETEPIKLSQDYIGYWRGEDETTDNITIYSINDDKIEFEWSVYRIGGIDRAIATLVSENTATFDYNDGYGIIFQGVIMFGDNEISLEITKSEGFEYITDDYKNTFNVKDDEYFAFIRSIR